MKNMVGADSIVRSIWGKGDTILFIFAGAAAEFALNKAVDWLYFTGKLPADPLGRLFSTVRYARMIVFSSEEEAYRAIDTINAIHQAVEKKRAARIPDWAYRDVLFMLIYYSIAAYELLERKMTAAEKQEVYDVFYRVGQRMGVNALPHTYTEWLPHRENHLKENLQHSAFSSDLLKQYKKHLGAIRYFILWEAQKLVLPRIVADLLHMNRCRILKPVLPLYRCSRVLKLDRWLRNMLLPQPYISQINDLDIV